MPITADIVKASNEQDSFDTYTFRKLYKEDVFPEYGPRFIDYWYDKTFYGRISRNEEVVVPKTMALKQIRSDTGTYFAINFVADAFDSLRRALQSGILRGVIQSHSSMYAVLKPRGGWSNGDNAYLSYLKIVDELFIETFLFKNNLIDEINSFGDYMKYYISFLDKMMNNMMPITKSGFIISKYCSPMISGLNIELNKGDHAKDREKFTYIQDLNFNVFRDTARKYGFVVDKNAPWRLTAELASPRMQSFARNYGLTYNPGSASNIIKSYYNEVYKQDLDLLITFFLFSYESFIEAFPISKKLKFSKCGNTTYTERFDRQHLKNEEHEKFYGDKYWLKLYFNLRLKENKIELFPPKLKIHLKQIEDLDKLWKGTTRGDEIWFDKIKFISKIINERILDMSSERWWIKSITKEEESDIISAVSAGDVTY